MIGYTETPDYVGLGPVIQNYDPSFGFVLKEFGRRALSDTTIALGMSLADMADAEKEGKISRQEYQDSKYFDENISWDESFTYAKARLLKERMDRERAYAYLVENLSGMDYAAAGIGLLGGSIPDPINFIPLLGSSSKAMRALRYHGLSQRMSRGILGAADAGITSTLASPLLMSERATYQQKYDAQDALIDISLSTGIGFAFGSVLGRIRPDDSFPPNDPTMEDLAAVIFESRHRGSIETGRKADVDAAMRDAARMFEADQRYLSGMDFAIREGIEVPKPVSFAKTKKGKIDQAIATVPPENRARAVAKAIQQIATGRPVDVASEMQPVVTTNDLRMQRLKELELRYNQYDDLTPEEFGELNMLADELEAEGFDLDNTVVDVPEPPPTEQVVRQVDEMDETEINREIEELDRNNQLSEEDADAIERLEAATSEETQKNLQEYVGQVSSCVIQYG